VPHAGRSVKYHRRRVIDAAPTGRPARAIPA